MSHQEPEFYQVLKPGCDLSQKTMSFGQVRVLASSPNLGFDWLQVPAVQVQVPI